MEELAVIIREPSGGIKIVEILGTGGVEFWKQNFAVATEAIEFKASVSEMEYFNLIHTNLLLTQLIQQKVITKRGVNIDPLIHKAVEIEYARTSWRWSRKQKLLKYFEHEHLKLEGIFGGTFWTRLKKEGIVAAIKFIDDRMPPFIKNIINFFKELDKKFNN